MALAASEIPDEFPAAVEAYLSGEGIDADGALIPPDAVPAVDPAQRIALARRLARVERRRAERRAATEAEVARLQHWLAEEDTRDGDIAARLRLVLEAVFGEMRERGEVRGKTLALPYGVKVAAHKQQDLWEHDDAPLLEWAQRSAPAFVEQRPHLRWGDLRKAASATADGGAVLAETGERIPGVTVQRRGEAVTVKWEEAGE